MKNTSTFYALFFAVMLMLAGCSAGTISGPELAPADEVTVQDTTPDGPNAAHNEGENKNGGSTVRTGGSHNKNGGSTVRTGGSHN
ncbi:MAG TPA: hypothetical protein VKP65_21365 [Rhodothermales bacterium]|nr:hypothetical protein [Rhodothermales bacterium]